MILLLVKPYKIIANESTSQADQLTQMTRQKNKERLNAGNSRVSRKQVLLFAPARRLFISMRMGSHSTRVSLYKVDKLRALARSCFHYRNLV